MYAELQADVLLKDVIKAWRDAYDGEELIGHLNPVIERIDAYLSRQIERPGPPLEGTGPLPLERKGE